MRSDVTVIDLAASEAAPDELPHRSSRWPDRRNVVGLTLAALLSLSLCVVQAFRVPTFFGADERGHFSYTVSLLEGRLPRITDPMPFTDRYPIIERSFDPPGPAPARPSRILVANHPPLHYLLAAPAVWLAEQIGPATLPTLAFRLVNALAMTVGVAMTGLFAAEVYPGQKRIAVGAAALAAVVPTLVAIGGIAHSDGTAFALAAACLFMAARLLTRGPSPGRLAVASAVAALAMLSRISLAPAVVAVAAAAALSVLRSGPRYRPLGLFGRALGAAAIIAGSAACAAGWFYLRNERLYGSLTADQFLFEMLGRSSQGSVIEVLVGHQYNWTMWSGLYGGAHPRLAIPHRGWVPLALLAVIAIGLLLAAARRSGRNEVETFADPQRPRGIGVWGWLILMAACVGTIVATARFFAAGGGAHPRYLLPVVPVLSALIARAVAELPFPRVTLAAIVGGLLGVIAYQTDRYQVLIDDPRHVHPFDDATVGVTGQESVAAVAGVVFVGLLAQWFGDWRAQRRTTVQRSRLLAGP